MSYDKYLEHIDTTMGADTPIAFGLHPNAEIDFRTQQSDTMFKVGKTFCQEQYLPDMQNKSNSKERPEMPLAHTYDSSSDHTWGRVA